jgi:hypothetical protein
MKPVERGRLVDVTWLVFVVAASSLWCVSASSRLSATFDEPTYIQLGLESWRTGSSGRLLDLGTMPLPMHLDTLPLFLWERWRGEAFDPARDLEVWLPVARLGTLPFWWLLLVSSWRAARRLAGPWGGRLAVVLLGCDPNLLAHAALATSDVPVTACLVSLLYHFHRGRDCKWGRRVGVPAGWFALAVLCKASGMMFAILGMAALAASRTRDSTTSGRRGWFRGVVERGFRRDLAQIVLIGLTVVFAYCGTDGRTSPSFVAWARSIADVPGGSALVWVAEHLRVFSNAGVALARQVRHNVQGHGVYLLGQVAERAIWYYYPAALSIKCPVPLLALPLLLAGLYPRALTNWALRVAAILLLFTLVCRVQIGIRLVLPLVALAAIGLASGLAAAASTLAPGGRRRVLAVASLLGCAWTAWAAAGVWPDALRYTNELWGGTAHGYRRLSDSNYDWGQGLHDLAGWRARHGIAGLDVLPYGSGSALEPLQMRRLPLAEFDGRTAEEALLRLRGRTVAISTTVLYGSLGELSYIKPIVTCLRGQRPVARTSTFLIFRIREEHARLR